MISQTKHGGSAKIPFQLSRAQAKLGHDVTIFTSDYQAEDQQAPEGVKLVKFHCALNLLGGIRITPGMMAANFSKYDIIHLHNYRLAVHLMAASASKPFVLSCHGNALPIIGRTAPLHNSIWQNMLMRRANKCLAVNKVEADQYLKERARPDSIDYLHIGLDFSEFQNIPAKTVRPYKTVLFLGRLDAIKGLDMLVEAFKILDRSDTRLIIAGLDYGYEEKVKRLVLESGLKNSVAFPGPLFGADKVRAYVNADVFVMPSSYESWGLTFMEALACGTQVLMTNRCGAADILPLECGLVVDYDPIEFAAGMDMMLDDVDKFNGRFNQYRKDWVRQFNWDSIAKDSIQIYKEVLTERCLRG